MSNSEYPDTVIQKRTKNVSFEYKLRIDKITWVGCMNTVFSTRMSSRNATLSYTGKEPNVALLKTCIRDTCKLCYPSTAQ